MILQENRQLPLSGSKMKIIIIDERMREREKQFFRNSGYTLIEIPKSNNVYPEISSHVDIFACKIDDTLILEKSQYHFLKDKLKDTKIKIQERNIFCCKNIPSRCSL